MAQPVQTAGLVISAHPMRGNDVATLAVRIQQQGDMGATIRIVFQSFDCGRDIVLVTLEINDPVVLLVATTPDAGS